MDTVVLDRDGVINRDSDSYIKDADEWIPLPGSLQAIAELHQAGYRVVVATNQSGLGRGLFDEYALARIHGKFMQMAEEEKGAVDGIFFCPHKPDEGCVCRKPATGLLHQIEHEFGCDLSGQYFVGDNLKDIQAALAHQMKPVLVRTGKGAATEQHLDQARPGEVPVFDDLLAAVRELILKRDCQ